MPGILHHPHLLECTAFTLSGEAVPNLFNLGIRYHENGNVHHFVRVYVPVEFQAELSNGTIKALHLEPLVRGEVASQLLEGSPDYLVMGLITKQRSRLGLSPKAFRQAHSRRLFWSLLAYVIALAVLPFSFSTVVGGFSLIVGTNLLRSARSIPRVPFFVAAERGWDFPKGN
jgi:hypothetical protein